jgi:hypothetical protein
MAPQEALEGHNVLLKCHGQNTRGKLGVQGTSYEMRDLLAFFAVPALIFALLPVVATILLIMVYGMVLWVPAFAFHLLQPNRSGPRAAI